MASSKPSKSNVVSFFFAGPGLLGVRAVLFLIGIGLGMFDTVTDWQLVIRFSQHGFNHPLLPIDVNWLRAWALFAAIGTVLFVASLTNETIDLLHSLWLVNKKCGSRKSPRTSRKDTKMNAKKQMNENINFETRQKDAVIHVTNYGFKESEEKEKYGEKDDDKEEITTVNDGCRCCYRCGWNFTTRAETLGKLSLWFQDVPMLTISVLYAFSQTTCKLPEVRDVSGDMFNVGLSAVASVLAVSFRLARSVLRTCISVGLRIKSKKETRKMGRLGKCCSMFLPEKGDALYPQGTCAQCCIVPFFCSIILNCVLVFLGFIITLVIWFNYLSLKRTPNFDDSLAIYRLTYNGINVKLLNISNNIIPARTNGSFIGFETVYDIEDNQVTHCLSEFQYREEDFDIFFNTVEVLAVSDTGEFCVTRSGTDLKNFATYSSCTIHYTWRKRILFYGFTDRLTGKITRFDKVCTVLKDRIPVVYDGPDPDPNIEVEDNLVRSTPPKSKDDLLILFVTRNQTNRIALQNISVANLVNQSLDASYYMTFLDQTSHTNVTYRIRLFYNYFRAQFTYNIREILNYSALNQSCLCSSDYVSSTRKFHQNGELIYGYYNPKTGRYPLLLMCSDIAPNLVSPLYNPFLDVGCSCG